MVGLYSGGLYSGGGLLFGGGGLYSGGGYIRGAYSLRFTVIQLATPFSGTIDFVS